MDLFLIVVIFIIGVIRVNKADSEVAGTSNEYIQDLNCNVTNKLFDSIEVGNNLMLYKEPDAFTKILKELGLKK